MTVVGVFALQAVDGATESQSMPAKLRICLDTGPNHVRTIVVRQFAENLQSRLPGRFKIEIYDSGQLYNDRDVIKGLLWGDMEMALPTTLQLARFEPSANVASLPVFYGQPFSVLQDVMSGKLGHAVSRRVEAHLSVKVLSPNLDLGYVNLFSTERPVRRPNDVAGLKVRIPGGIGNIQRLRLQGAYPLSIPWSDVPLALSQGNVDALATTFETLQSGALWEVGVRFGLEERAMFLQYVPLLRRDFWQQLDPETRSAFARVWIDTMEDARLYARERQMDARKKAQDNDVQIYTLSNRELSEQRQALRHHDDAFVELLRIPLAIVDLAEHEMSRARDRHEHE